MENGCPKFFASEKNPQITPVTSKGSSPLHRHEKNHQEIDYQVTKALQ